MIIAVGFILTIATQLCKMGMIGEQMENKGENVLDQ